jgi:hypothetical protein
MIIIRLSKTGKKFAHTSQKIEIIPDLLSEERQLFSYAFVMNP